MAQSDYPVLLLGERGTGKEEVARFVHHHSPRRGRPFVAVNCAALPETLVESELFGHEQGAFTGATQRRVGKFEQADDGTIFLDEIGNMPLNAQPALLRIMEEHELQRVGGTEVVQLSARVIAATNRDVVSTGSQGFFMEDLFDRLNVLTIEVPPLAQRREDIPELVEHFRHREGIAQQVPDRAIQALKRARWPGNVRELLNALIRASILNPGHRYLRPEDFNLNEPGIDTAIASAEERRRQILTLVDQHGPTTSSEIRCRLGGSSTTVWRDLQVLRDGGEVAYRASNRTWGRTDGSHVHREVPALVPLQQRILQELEARGPCAMRQFLKALKTPRRTIHRNIVELVDRGLVRRGGQGRGTTYRLAAG